MAELMNGLNAQMAATSKLVQIWMCWMGFIFFVSVVFLKNHIAARYTLAVNLLSIPAAIVIFHYSRNVHLLGIVHLILWGPLAFYLFKSEIKTNQFNVKNPYYIWVSLLTLTIIISLVFDIRDIYLVMTGKK